MRVIFFLFLAISFISQDLSAQDTPISTGGTVTVDCGGDPINLTDSGLGGNYEAGESYTMTFCPGDGGNAVIFLIDTETQGDVFDIAGNDNLTVFDGMDTSAPILGVYNNNLFTGGVLYLAATLDNPSGCLTFLFESSENSNGGAGWTSQVNCGNFWQPFDMEFTSSPVDIDTLGNYIDVCQNTEITLTADGIFPYSDGNGYEQTNANCYFEWDLGDGTVMEGYGLTEIIHTFPGAFGYPIELFVTDPEGLIKRFVLKVRVSTTPNFTGVLSQFRDTICLGGSVTLTGGLSGVTVNGPGVVPTPGNFVSGGFLAGQTFLPDGTGASYTTVINLSDFPPTTTITDASNIVSICATMEHSYLGDLDIELSCPNGSSILLQGQGGGSCNLGIPWATGGVDGQSGNITPGEGFEYCWTPDATLSLEDGCEDGIEFLSGDGPGTYTDSQVQPGDYSPDENFDALIGCPVNGDWTITVTDNLGADNGYIFSWGVTFSADIQPEIETYYPMLTEGHWLEAPSITVFSDTVITVSPDETGEFGYTFSVTDDFNCTYDTTVVITVLPAVLPSVIEPACNLSLPYEVENQYAGGTWSYASDYDSLFVYNFGVDAIDVSAPGDYVLSYYDNFCQTSHDFPVAFIPYPYALILKDTTELCSGQEEFLYLAEQINGLNVNYYWLWDSLGTQFTLGNESSQAVYFGGEYQVQIIDVICGNYAADEAFVLEEPCIIETYNVFTPNGDGENDYFYIRAIEKFRNPVVYVYNRWGNVVFEKSNYRNDWDMADLSEGTYFYVILNPANSESFKGSFTLMR